MNFAAFERAQVAAFAYREARFTGSLDCMRAVCFVLRNRVKSAWGDGTWLTVMEMAYLTAASCDAGSGLMSGAPDTARSGDAGASANSASTGMLSGFRSDDRLLQLIVRDVDDIYLGQESFEDNVAQVTGARKPMSMNGSSGERWRPALYYSFVERPVRPWFVVNIIRNGPEHPQMGQIGHMMLYG
jgi:hypothetical protein